MTDPYTKLVALPIDSLISNMKWFLRYTLVVETHFVNGSPGNPYLEFVHSAYLLNSPLLLLEPPFPLDLAKKLYFFLDYQKA